MGGLPLGQGQEHLSTKNPEFQSALAALAAPLRGIEKEDLIGEDVRQHRRALLLARGAALVLVVLLILAGWQWREAEAQRTEAVVQRNEAVVQRERAEEQASLALSRQLAAQSQVAREENLDLSLLLSAQAFQTANNSRPDRA